MIGERLTLDDAPDVLTVGEAARLARVGRNAMYQVVARGEIYSVRIGRSVRIPKVALRRFLGVASAETEQAIDELRLPLGRDALQSSSDDAASDRQELALAKQLEELGVQGLPAGQARRGATVLHRGNGSAAADHTIARAGRTRPDASVPRRPHLAPELPLPAGAAASRAGGPGDTS